MSLSDNAWKHIRDRHPELSSYEIVIKETAMKPDFILRGNFQELKAVRFIANTHIGPKYLVVVYREENSQKIIITAYFTSDLKKVKGERIWKA